MERLTGYEGWDIVRSIGSGGFGRVYEIKKVDELGNEMHSALKVISIPEEEGEVSAYRDDGYDEESITTIFKNRAEDIAREFNLLSKLKGNSNIVSYEDHSIIQHIGSPGWDICIRMELLTSLPEYYASQFPKGIAAESAVIRMGIDICRALELCGKYDIIHRDIKPQNIFINDLGSFKLGDFGTAKTSDHTTKATKTGTYGYMAPEVYMAQPYNASVDIYSLGLVMYWMLNERRGPFLPYPPAVPRSIEMEEALGRRISGEALPAPRHGSQALQSIVLKACCFDPLNRWTNATEMRKALEALETDRDMTQSLLEEVEEKTVGIHRAPALAHHEDKYTMGEDTVGIFDEIPLPSSHHRKRSVGKKRKVRWTIAGIAMVFATAAILTGLMLPKLRGDTAAQSQAAMIEDEAFVDKINQLTPELEDLPTIPKIVAEGTFQYSDAVWSMTDDKVLTLSGTDDHIGSLREEEINNLPFTPEIVVIGAELTGSYGGGWSKIDTIKEFRVEEGNPEYEAIEGVLYRNDKIGKVLVDCPKGYEGVIDIPEGVKEVGQYAFSGKMAGIKIPASVIELPPRVLMYFDLSTVQIAEGSIYRLSDKCLYKEAAYGTYTLERCYDYIQECFVVPDGIVGIGENAFRDCDQLQEIVLPQSVTTIGGYAFYDCDSLKKVNIPSNAIYIGEKAFCWSDNIETIAVDETNEVFFVEDGILYESVLETCRLLYAFGDVENVVVPDETAWIAPNAFDGYSPGVLKSITLPAGLVSIGELAFSTNCDSMETIYYRGTPEQWKQVQIGDYNEEFLWCTLHTNYKG